MTDIRRAFTLIELMVVVAIISILTSLLVPAISAARSAAMSAQCMAHLRQIPMAVEAYAQETHGQLVLTKIGMGALQKQWETLLADQVPDVLGGARRVEDSASSSQARKSIVRGCPSFQQSLNISASVALIWTTGFGMNARPLLPTSFYTYNWLFPTSGTQLRFDRIEHQSQRILCGDGDDWWLNGLGAGNNWGTATQPRTWEPSGNRTSGFIRSGREAWRRHRGYANYGFFDGHVQRLGSARALDQILDPSNRLGLNVQ